MIFEPALLKTLKTKQIIQGLAKFPLFDLFSGLRHYFVLLNPENKPHAGKWMKFEVIYYQHFSKALVQKSLSSIR